HLFNLCVIMCLYLKQNKKMHFIEITYITAAIVALSAGIPQLRQLLISKASDEFSLSTWLIWLSTQCVTLVYVATVRNTLMIYVSLAWVLFHAAMVVLIVYYRRYALRKVPVVLEDELA